ncbi:HugZ family protein [Chthonobacter albigriseus]|uniref:HugZ family pyridoxamine 5'-phosphate oxidase n=1 Tax=Chthonobacter albigriseus TaxID=1683161 RepID=UPI0015EE9DB7|nr:DUF2470 domain-containing protein [Chthonobacter albigriseus]
MPADGDFDPIRAAAVTLRASATGALATLGSAGTPFASFVTVATDHAGAPLLLLSRLAVHTRNLDRDGRASLLLVAPGGEGGDPLAGSRITLEGAARRIAPGEDLDRARARFLARHPEAEGYAGFTDFGFFRFQIDTAHLVAGFGRIHTVPAADILVEATLAGAFSDAEHGILAHMNQDHADAVRLYATRLLGQPDGDWHVVAADADGLDLFDGQTVARLPFRSRQASVQAVRFELKALSERART